MDVKRRLRSRGYRVTPQREAVLEVLRENEGVPLDPEAVFEFTRERYAGIGLATVYRTLELFCDLGLVLRVQLKPPSSGGMTVNPFSTLSWSIGLENVNLNC